MPNDQADAPDSLLASLDSTIGDLCSRMRIAYDGARTWVDGIRAALFACLAFFDEDPRRARFMVLETLAGDPPVRARRDRLLGVLAERLESQRPLHGDTGEDPGHAQAVVGAVAAVIHARLLEEPTPKLTPLAAILMSVIVMPYLGATAARDELERTTETPAA
jgi:hypothetical protein